MLSERRDEGGVLASLDSRDVADFGHLRERERSLQHDISCNNFSNHRPLSTLCHMTSLQVYLFFSSPVIVEKYEVQ
ncbi:hypothetical protein K402DRAFT_221632 [Aulographum hederae CBS 113979]|uniref:Uncharacterized protein n=1 Tax=Aulographum hederae CBS 113979 TaxID=1176131 RepID=A0A6G1GLN0_9PEZI|nr:hypothetical protein K402DRAFT_221632 [Aulographum hederae CBS 113979]